jgi:hypothetical protein
MVLASERKFQATMIVMPLIGRHESAPQDSGRSVASSGRVG